MNSSTHVNETNNDEAEHSCQQAMERLALGVSESVLKSPTEMKVTKLSAAAPEFVPSWMKNQQSTLIQQNSNANNFTSPASEANNSFDGNTSITEVEVNQYLIPDIQNYLIYLKNSPASFHEMAETILSLLITYVSEDTVLAVVIDEIFRAGLEDQNFTYQCARLCAYLAENYWRFDGSNNTPQASALEFRSPAFRQLLLKRIREEYETWIHGPIACLYNFGLFLADLYNQVKVSGTNVVVLGDAILDVLNVLLDQPNDGNVACAVRILKCCGSTLDVCERRIGGGDHASTPKLDALFLKFEMMLNSSPNAFGLSDDGKMLIRNLMSNRVEWKKMPTTPAAGDGFQSPPAGIDDQRISGDMVFFGPDGAALTAEEAAFLEQELGALQSSSSEEEAAFAGMFNSAQDDELDDAYEEFLRMTEAKKRQQQLK